MRCEATSSSQLRRQRSLLAIAVPARRQQRLPARTEEQKKQERRDSYNRLQQEYYIRGTATQERAFLRDDRLNTTKKFHIEAGHFRMHAFSPNTHTCLFISVSVIYYRSAAPIRLLVLQSNYNITQQQEKQRNC